MKIFKCRECKKIFHKNMKYCNCIYCGCDDVESVQNIESISREALRHYENGCKYLEKKEFNDAKEEFFLATRFDLKYSEAYWMGYMAEIGVCGEDELIYSGKLDEKNSVVVNAILYANSITKEIYQETIRIDGLIKKELILMNKTKYEEKKRIEIEKNNYEEMFKKIHDEYAEILKCKRLILESEHKKQNLKWWIKQKYVNTEYAQLLFCNDVIEEYTKRDYKSIARTTQDIIELLAIQKYQGLINVTEVEEKCKLSSEYGEIINENAIEKDLSNKIKEHNNMLEKYKKMILGYIGNVEVLEQLKYEKDSYEELYRGIDTEQPLMNNYDKVKMQNKKDINYRC